MSATTKAGMRAAMNSNTHGSSVASAGTINLDTTTGDLVDLTYTGTPITAITLADGQRRMLYCESNILFVHGSLLKLSGATNILTRPRDMMEAIGIAGGVVVCAYIPYAQPYGAYENVALMGDSIIQWDANGGGLEYTIRVASKGRIQAPNYGIPAERMTNVASTQLTLALSGNPHAIVCCGGVNDIVNDSNFAAQEVHYNTILAACVAAKIPLFVEEIMPSRGWNQMNDTRATTLIAWNVSLAAWVVANTGVELVRTYDLMGEPGNTTYRKAAYSNDGVHPNGTANLGQEAHAALLLERLMGRNKFSDIEKGLVPKSGGGTVNFLRADGTWTTDRSVAFQTLADAAPIVYNANNGANAVLTMVTDARTLSPPSNTVAGMHGTLKIIQHASSPKTLTFTGWFFPGGVAPTLTATNGAVDILNWYSDGTKIYGGLIKAWAVI